MAYCPNKNLEEWKLLVSSRGEDIAYYLWDKYEGNVPEIESKQSIVKAGLKAIQILNSDKAKQIFDKGNKNNWSLEKILAELAVPREQRELIKGLGKTNLNEIVTDLLANYSYTIEINTAKEKPVKQLSLDSPESFIDDFGNEYTRDYSDTHEGFDYFKNGNLITKQQFDKEYQDSLDDVVENQNTQYYSNLTVPGGTNYTENEIATPAITPSIKGHAQFSTDNGIGWFRSDDKTIDNVFSIPESDKSFVTRVDDSLRTPTKTRRILEVQSDLYQKSRDIKSPDEIIAQLQKEGKLKIDCN